MYNSWSYKKNVDYRYYILAAGKSHETHNFIGIFKLPNGIQTETEKLNQSVTKMYS